MKKMLGRIKEADRGAAVVPSPLILILFLPIILTSPSCTPQEATTAPPPPNILFAIADDASFPHMGAYGTDWVSTPAFDRVARDGVLFTRAYTNNAKCSPSRSIILTGRHSWQLEAAVNHWAYFPPKFKSVVEALGEAGYFTGHTAKGFAPGIVLDEDGNPRDLVGPKFNEHQLEPPAKFISTNDYAANFEAFLEARPEEKPFLFWYGSIEPHRYYDYGVGLRHGKSLSDIDKVPDFWPDTDSVRTDLLDYAFEIEYFDQHLQRMLDHLEEIGELDNTVVIVTADNGMPFPRIKGQAYEMSNHLPLAIMWPDGIATPGRTVDDLVSFLDMTPTFLELAGVDHADTGMHPVEGSSFVDLLASAEGGVIDPSRDHVLIGKERHDVGRPNDGGYPIRGVVKGDLLYIRNFEPERWPSGDPITGYLNCDGGATKTVCLDAGDREETRDYWRWSFGKRPEVELYNVKTDPFCMINLAGDPAYAASVSELDALMVRELTAQGDPRILGNGDVLEAYQYADLKTARFYERVMAGEELKAGWVNLSDFREAPE